MTKAMPFLQKYDITFLRPPTICRGLSFCVRPDRPFSEILNIRQGVFSLLFFLRGRSARPAKTTSGKTTSGKTASKKTAKRKR